MPRSSGPGTLSRREDAVAMTDAERSPSPRMASSPNQLPAFRVLTVASRPSAPVMNTRASPESRKYTAVLASFSPIRRWPAGAVRT